ncbi:unnamed protein product [Hymenolepis diminuta]|uniref:Uncharacterized protein n=1 Tax=Hymenolepis diminuta TaxID=6216 RepID=A0A564YGZ2_HYMDI|nr:unnamed protein product [Hymenolepis diminuta]
MTHDPYLPCQTRPSMSPLFYNRLASHKKHICTHALARPYLSDSYKAIFVFHTETTHASRLRTPTRPIRLLSSSARCPLSLCYSFQTRSGFLEYIFRLINSVSQLLAPIQTATNC